MDKLTREKLEDGRIQIISPLEFNFQSQEDPESYYLVDLSAHDGSGACFCQNFQFRIEPKIKSGKIKPHEKGSQCKHITTAKLILGQKVIEASMKNLGQNATQETS
jgi:hypothetical protein